MKLIVGLGNPGKKYEGTRHNVGRMAIQLTVKKSGVKLKKDKDARIAKINQEGEPVILAVLESFMNLSGPSLHALVKRIRVESIADLLVVTDDIHLPLGNLRFRSAGSAGGHNGLASIIEALGSDQFARVRIGIGKPEPRDQTWRDYVLEPFMKEEQAVLGQSLERASECALAWVHQSAEQIMQRFN